jgi:RHS repeat-associated protein
MQTLLISPYRIKQKRRRRRKIVSVRQHYNYFRDYEPGTGRYPQSDPIGLFGSISTYAYVDSRPINNKDFLGLKSSITCPVCVPKIQGHSRARDAALVVLRAVNPISMKYNLEICGNICQDNSNNKFFFVGSVVGTFKSCIPGLAPCPPCSTKVAWWHTHGRFMDSNRDGKDDFGGENFSGNDAEYSNSTGLDAYLATPVNTFLYYPVQTGQPQNLGRISP